MSQYTGGKRGRVISNDRTFRSLAALNGASTARVLNLSALATRTDDPAYASTPLFRSAVINTSIILKHRVRGDETYVFSGSRMVATKIIIPFEKTNLRLGGRSFFVDQHGYKDTLRQIGQYRDDGIESDLSVLRLIDRVPSLDPFLLREHLRTNGINVADCYFQISDSDKRQMYEFVADDIRALIGLASAKDGNSEAATSRLVSALLSTEIDEKLEPLRRTLRLEGKPFAEGVFSWRGFLYYKWCVRNYGQSVSIIAREIRQLRPTGQATLEELAYIDAAQKRIIGAIIAASKNTSAVLQVYDNAYSELVNRGQPNQFRDFLLSAPGMFLDLGEKMGAISHLISFWRYRFPEDREQRIDVEELTAILQDFETSFGVQVGAEISTGSRAVAPKAARR